MTVDVVKLREGAHRALGLSMTDVSRIPAVTSVILDGLAQGVLELLAEREALVERLRLMAAAEREGARDGLSRAVAYETAAEMVAGGSPL